MLRQKTTLIALGIGALIVLAGIAAAILIPRGAPSGPEATPDPGDQLPFGEESGARDLSGLFPDENGEEIPVPDVSGPPILRQTDLRQLTNAPVSGAWAYSNTENEEAHTFVRYTDRATGHIYEIDLEGFSQPRKLTQVTVPRLQEALWASTGSSTVLRYLNETAERIRTFAADIVGMPQGAEDTPPPIPYTYDGTFLRDDITSITYAPNGRSLFYLIAPPDGARGFLSGTAGESQREIFRSQLRELQATWAASGGILVTTKASADAPGFAFLVDPQTGASETILTNQTALVASLSPSGDSVVFFSRDGSTPVMRVLSLADESVRHLPLVTLPDEKCVWSRREPNMIFCAVPATIPTGSYPDAWYRGDVMYEDVIWRINTDTAATDLLVAPASADTGLGVDAEHLFLDDAERYLFFTNRRDGTLWSVRIDTLLADAFPTEE